MKKLIIILFIAISFQSFSQNVIADWAYLRQRFTLKDSIVTAITSGDTLATIEKVRSVINDSISTYTFITLGTANQIPFVNALGTDFDYSDNVKYDGKTVFLGNNLYNISIAPYSALEPFYYDINNGGNNIVIGAGLSSNTTGSGNISIGNGAGYNNNGDGNVFIGDASGQNETGSNKLYIDNSSSSNPLIKGDFATDELWLNTDTTHIVGHLEVDSNLYVFGRSILEKYEAAAYLDPDSTIVTNVNSTSWTFIGAGSNNKFTNIYSKGFALDGDTLYFVQNANDTRDSVEFNFSAHATTATGSVNRTIYYSIQIKSVGETVYSEERQITSKVRTQSAGVYYSGATCTPMPVFLKNGDKIQLVQKCQTGTATVSMQDAKVYLKEQ